MNYRKLLSHGIAITAALISSSFSYAGTEVHLSSQVIYNQELPFVTHHSNNPMDNALAMNIKYAPVKSVRNELSTALNFQLKYFTGWNENGEAHITVITPPEYANVIKPYVSMERIEELANEYGIQKSIVDIIGIGSGETAINNHKEQTYFLIVTSQDLLNLRYKIYDEYVKNGGPKDGWDPAHFYPHITIGYTARDLFEADGVIKDANHSLDTRFELAIVD